MVEKTIKFYFAAGLLFIIMMVFYVWTSVSALNDAGRITAAESFDELRDIMKISYITEGSFGSDSFSLSAREYMNANPELEGFMIYSADSGVYYMSFRTAGTYSGPLTIQDGWKGSPGFSAGSLFCEVLSSPLSEDGIMISGIYKTVTRSGIFPVLRNTLAALCIFLIITAVLIAFSSPGRKDAESFARSPETTDSAFGKQASGESATEETDTSAAGSSCEENSGQLFSPKSGLVWGQFLNEKLAEELKRAASFDQDICLGFIRIKSPSGFIPYRNISELIIDCFSYRDLAFENGESGFSVIIPDKDIDEGLLDVERFKKAVASRFPESAFRIHSGLTSRNGRLLNSSRMIQEAKVALAKASEDRESSIVAFRTDLNKYRQFIASSRT